MLGYEEERRGSPQVVGVLYFKDGIVFIVFEKISSKAKPREGSKQQKARR